MGINTVNDLLLYEAVPSDKRTGKQGREHGHRLAVNFLGHEALFLHDLNVLRGVFQRVVLAGNGSLIVSVLAMINPPYHSGRCGCQVSEKVMGVDGAMEMLMSTTSFTPPPTGNTDS